MHLWYFWFMIFFDSHCKAYWYVSPSSLMDHLYCRNLPLWCSLPLTQAPNAGGWLGPGEIIWSSLTKIKQTPKLSVLPHTASNSWLVLGTYNLGRCPGEGSMQAGFRKISNSDNQETVTRWQTHLLLKKYFETSWKFYSHLQLNWDHCLSIENYF